MPEEAHLQKEWREIVIKKLDAVDGEVKKLQNEVREAMSISKDVNNLKDWVKDIDKKVGEHTLSNASIKNEILEEVKASYTSKDQFEPVKKLVWSGVGIILAAFLGGLLTLVWIKGH